MSCWSNACAIVRRWSIQLTQAVADKYSSITCVLIWYVHPRCILKNKGRLRSVEEELNTLHRSIQQTCGSRRQGITLLRTKIEAQNDKVLSARQRFFVARKVRGAKLLGQNIEDSLCSSTRSAVSSVVYAPPGIGEVTNQRFLVACKLQTPACYRRVWLSR